MNVLRRSERSLRSRRHGVVDVLVVVSNVGHVHGLVDVNIVVDVCDLRAIDNYRVRNVYTFNVAFAYVIRRAVDVTRPKREPRNSNGRGSADRDANSPMRSANP